MKEAFAGFDVGKKRHPSHLSAFWYDDGDLIQFHQSFLDETPYTEQVEYLKEATRNWGIIRGYYDNTRAELEERNLPLIWKPITFTSKLQGKLGSSFERRVMSKRIKLLDNERCISQILSVDNAFKAPETAEGHGDAFWSTVLAIHACEDFHPFEEGGSRLEIGDVASIFKSGEIEYNIIEEVPPTKIVDVFGKKKFTYKCSKCGKAEGLSFFNGQGNCSLEEAIEYICLICGNREKL